jgi:urease beta subunit
MKVEHSAEAWMPGQVWTAGGELESLKNRTAASVRVTNTGDRPIQVGSHFHFFEVNKALAFTRAVAWGRRLAIPSGTAIRFEPGLEYEVELIDLGGERVVHGFNGLVEGALDDPAVRAAGLARAKAHGFHDEPEGRDE